MQVPRRPLQQTTRRPDGPWSPPWVEASPSSPVASSLPTTVLPSDRSQGLTFYRSPGRSKLGRSRPQEKIFHLRQVWRFTYTQTQPMGLPVRTAAPLTPQTTLKPPQLIGIYAIHGVSGYIVSGTSKYHPKQNLVGGIFLLLALSCGFLSKQPPDPRMTCR